MSGAPQSFEFHMQPLEMYAIGSTLPTSLLVFLFFIFLCLFWSSNVSYLGLGCSWRQEDKEAIAFLLRSRPSRRLETVEFQTIQSSQNPGQYKDTTQGHTQLREQKSVSHIKLKPSLFPGRKVCIQRNKLRQQIGESIFSWDHIRVHSQIVMGDKH